MLCDGRRLIGYGARVESVLAIDPGLRVADARPLLEELGAAPLGADRFVVPIEHPQLRTLTLEWTDAKGVVGASFEPVPPRDTFPDPSAFVACLRPVMGEPVARGSVRGEPRAAHPLNPAGALGRCARTLPDAESVVAGPARAWSSP